MHEHHLTLNLVPPGHPGMSRPVGGGDDKAIETLRHAMAEGELLRARLRQLASSAACDPAECDPAIFSEAA
jgi:hypothetical protein